MYVNAAVLLIACAKEVPMSSSSAPLFACHMDALTSDERERARALREQLVAATRATTEIENGYRFSYSDSVFLDVAEWISYERRCCPFLDFAINWKGDRAVVDVAITGPAGVKLSLRAEMPELPAG